VVGQQNADIADTCN